MSRSVDWAILVEDALLGSPPYPCLFSPFLFACYLCCLRFQMGPDSAPAPKEDGEEGERVALIGR